jgi:hypothetical protein
MKTIEWNELRVLLREKFEFNFYNNKNKWGRTIKVNVHKNQDSNLIEFIKGLGYENVDCRRHMNGPWDYVMIDIKD